MFESTPGAVGEARHYVSDCVPAASQELRARLRLMVSELATNCVQHAATGFTVVVHTSPHEIRVEVADTGGGEPTVRSPKPTEPSGRGLRIVKELADTFGVEHDDGSAGKTVWFVVRTAGSGGDVSAGGELAMAGGEDAPAEATRAETGGTTPSGPDATGAASPSASLSAARGRVERGRRSRWCQRARADLRNGIADTSRAARSSSMICITAQRMSRSVSRRS